MTDKELLEELKSILREGGGILLDLYKKDYPQDQKDAWLPVTEADMALDKFFVDKLKQYKDFGILSEESKELESRLDYDKVFIVDSLDGTKDFLHKTGDFSIILGVVEKGETTLGLVYHPLTDTMYYATKGQGAYMESGDKKTKLQVSSESDFEKMKILISRYHLADDDLELIKKFGFAKQSMGSAGLKICEIAKGNAHIYINNSPKTGEWDIAGAKVILEEAGGTMTDASGQDLVFNKKSPFNTNGFAATNGPRHNELVSYG